MKKVNYTVIAQQTLITVGAFLLLCFNAFAQAPTVSWQTSVGGASHEYGWSAQQTFDGGYIVCGNSLSDSTTMPGHHGGLYTPDALVTKFSSQGVIQWTKCYGGTGYDYAESIIQTPDSGYIFCGGTNSHDGDVNANKGQYDLWVVKLNKFGNIQWQKTYGGSYQDYGSCIIRTNDNRYVICGYTLSNDGDVSGYHGYIYGGTSADGWFIKLQLNGSLIWQHCYGGTFGESFSSVVQNSDNTFCLAGMAESTNGDVSINNGMTDGWIVKTNPAGQILWNNIIGGDSYDNASMVQKVIGGGYIVCGSTLSSGTGAMPNNKGLGDAFLSRLSPNGNILWTKTYGGSLQDNGYSVRQLVGGGYLLACGAASADSQVVGNNGGTDMWVVRTNVLGTIVWSKTIGGIYGETATSAFVTADGGIAVCGYEMSSNPFNKGSQLSLVKLSAAPREAIEELDEPFSLYPNPVSGNHMTLQMKETGAGTIEIYDIFGKKYCEKIISPNTQSIDVSIADLKPGVYYVRLVTEGESYTQKVIRQ